MKHDPKKVFIKAKDGYLELTYEEHCSQCEGAPPYQNRRFLFLHGMLMEVSEKDYAAFYKDKRRQKYLMEQSADHQDVSMDALLADSFRGEDTLRIRYNKLRKLNRAKKVDTACRSLVE